MEFLGERLRRLREERELGQAELARKVVVAQNTYSQYETNSRTPSLETLKVLTEVFEVSVDYLAGIVDVPYNPREAEFRQLVEVYVRLDQRQRRELLAELRSQYREGA